MASLAMHGPHGWSLQGTGARTTGSLYPEAPGREATQNHHCPGGEKGFAGFLTTQENGHLWITQQSPESTALYYSISQSAPEKDI